MFKFVHSIRFRVWTLFIGFTSAILIFLYINQVALLPAYYDFLKTREAVSAAAILNKKWEAEDFVTQVMTLSKDKFMRIQVDYIDSETGARTSFYQNPNDAFPQVILSQSINEQNYFEVYNSIHGVITKKLTSPNGNSYLMLITMIGTKDNVKGYITIHNYIEPLGNTSEILQNQFFLSAAILLFIAFIISAFVVMTISNPIIKISNSAKKLATGEFNMDISPHSYAEIKSLVNNLNKASCEIAKTENLRKDLLANVSHDLKTPLTMIKAYSEMIRDLSGDNPEKREKHLQVIIEEADRLNSLVIDLLDLSKLQSGVAEKQSGRYDFSMHLNGVVNRFLYLSENNGYSINTQIEDEICINADPAKIEQAVYNLIINAINYTGEDKIVTVKLYKRAETKTARFEVADTGKGIPPEELDCIWERYYRANKSEHYKRAQMGTGLGLSIVKGVLDMHSFTYGVKSTVGEGSMFWFEFPITE